MRHSLTTYMIGTLLLGILDLFNLLFWEAYAVSTPITIVIYLGVLTLAYLTGRSARRHHVRPGWLGGAVGVLFGLVAGTGSFLVRLTLHNFDVSTPGMSRIRLLALANSSLTHWLALGTAVVTFGVMSLIVSSLGALSVSDRDGDSSRHSVPPSPSQPSSTA